MLDQAIQSYLTKNKFTEFDLKAVFFDMDGVLFDSMPHHAVAWAKAMNESGLPFTELDAYMNEGQTATATINSVFAQKNGRNATEEEKKAIYDLKSYYFNKLGAVNQIPFAYEILKKIKAKGLKMFVVTGSALPSLINSLTNNFPGIFEKDCIISAFDVKKGKPNPEPYLKALKRAAVMPWQAVVIENAPLGVQASSAAEIFTIGVNTGPLDEKTLSNNGADIVLSSMQELYEKWDEFGLNRIHTAI